MKIVNVYTAQPGGKDPTPVTVIVKDPLPNSKDLASAAKLMDEQAALIVNSLRRALPSGVLDRVTTKLLQAEVKERLLHVAWMDD